MEAGAIASFPSQHDTELKRKYLSLLPPTQIIDICLSFEAYAPFHVRSQIWPGDLNVSIAALSLVASRQNGKEAAETPIMDSLTDASNPAPPPPIDTGQNQAGSSTSRASSQQPAPLPPSPIKPTQTPVIVSTPVHPPGPQYQPYQFAASQPAYPHAPYYQASGYYPPPPTYFPPPQQPQVIQHTHSASTNAVSPPPPPPPPPDPQTTASTEDLPSYEEMIVEALQECTDPDGMVPKNIFSRMQQRYPLHTNFRPSASQALQKAYKRGRLLKNEDEGDKRYKLNPNWGGGSTSKRTTRRPQTQAQSLHGAPSPPPRSATFIQASPIHLRHPQLPPSSHPDHHPHHPPPPVSATDTGDAWQAAQNILKAINFEELLNKNQDDSSHQGTDGTSAPTSTIENAAMQPQHQYPLVPVPPPPPIHQPPIELIPVRAELQAHLALLTAQLFEIVKEEETAAAAATEIRIEQVSPRAAPPTKHLMEMVSAPPPGATTVDEDEVLLASPTTEPQPHPSPRKDPEEDDEDEDDMEEIVV